MILKTNIYFIYNIDIQSFILILRSDYLIGKTSLKIDAKLLKRLEDIEALNDEGRSFVLRVLDMSLRDIKTQASYA